MIKIMIVDDDELVREVLKSVLKKNNVMLNIFECPLKALDYFASVDPDLLITDYCMDGIKGIELIKRCKYKNPTLPTIIITGHSKAIIENENNYCHFVNDYVFKPITPREIRHSVNIVTGKVIYE